MGIGLGVVRRGGNRNLVGAQRDIWEDEPNHRERQGSDRIKRCLDCHRVACLDVRLESRIRQFGHMLKEAGVLPP